MKLRDASYLRILADHIDAGYPVPEEERPETSRRLREIADDIVRQQYLEEGKVT